mmetsp:Transcript_140524/g.436983  ORF Transcript_140524/g.436983 Transcript_140524/m.436983 type:complete len:232 (+) Transcript_140524:233-928(+)
MSTSAFVRKHTSRHEAASSNAPNPLPAARLRAAEIPVLTVRTVLWTLTRSITKCTYAKGSCVSRYFATVPTPSAALMHVRVTCAWAKGWDCRSSSASELTRRIQVHTAVGRCQARGKLRRKAASRTRRRPIRTKCDMSSLSRAAMTMSSMAANPYFWTWVRTLSHCLLCSSHARIVQRFAKESYTVCRARVRMAHHRARQRIMYWPRMKTATLSMWLIRASRGPMSRSPRR